MSDNFGWTDRLNITETARALKIPGYKGYLGTPSGLFKVFDPVTGQVRVLP